MFHICFFSSDEMKKGAILIKHPLPPTAAPNPRIVEDDKKSSSPPLRLALNPEEVLIISALVYICIFLITVKVEEAKRLRFNDPFGWSQAALAR